MTDKVEVTVADRVTYLDLNGLPEDYRRAVAAGKWDHTTGMQVIARHRLAAEARAFEAGALAMREAASEKLEECCEPCLQCHTNVCAIDPASLKEVG
jgi:hypothetical protein